MIKFEAVKRPRSKFWKKHKLVVKFKDCECGLRGFVSIHNDNLGPAVGGTRMFPYKSEADALGDDLRLSEAMTYKCALAGVPYGGGKGVIIGNPKTDKTDELLISYAKVVNHLRGRFRTGEDVGISEENVQLMLDHSKYFIGKSSYAGDPSPFAGLSTYVSMKAAVLKILHKRSLNGIHVSVKGVGKVGTSLVDLLVENGAKVTIADIDPKAVKRLLKKYKNIQAVDYRDIFFEPADVYAPCAMGSEFNLQNAKKLKAGIICGGANNQLASREVGIMLKKLGIVYVPDYIANAGGLINVVDELERGGYKEKRVIRRIENIRKTVNKVLSLSSSTGKATNVVSDRMAEEIFNMSRIHKHAS